MAVTAKNSNLPKRLARCLYGTKTCPTQCPTSEVATCLLSSVLEGFALWRHAEGATWDCTGNCCRPTLMAVRCSPIIERALLWESPDFALLSFWQQNMIMEQWQNDTDRRKPTYSEKNIFRCHFLRYKSDMDWLGLRGERTATGRTSQGMAATKSGFRF